MFDPFAAFKLVVVLLCGVPHSYAIAQDAFRNWPSFSNSDHDEGVEFDTNLQIESLKKSLGESVMTWELSEANRCDSATPASYFDRPGAQSSSLYEQLDNAVPPVILKPIAIHASRISSGINAERRSAIQFENGLSSNAILEKSILLSFGSGEFLLAEVDRGSITGRCRCRGDIMKVKSMRPGFRIFENRVLIEANAENLDYQLLVLSDGRLYILKRNEQPRLKAQIDPEVWNKVLSKLVTNQTDSESASDFARYSKFAGDSTIADKDSYFLTSQGAHFRIEFSNSELLSQSLYEITELETP